MAQTAAVAEALERYAGAWCPLAPRPRAAVPAGEPVITVDDLSLYSSEQRRTPGFPHLATLDRDAYVAGRRLHDGAATWVPAAVVSLDPQHGTIATSNGLAAGPDAATATLRAVQELVERDAFMAIWLHQLARRQVAMAEEQTAPVAQRGGWVVAIDATPAASPHPVAMVAGTVPIGGRARNSLGLACRSTWAAAVDKAYLEWAQGVTFVGHRAAGASIASADQVRDFDDHALFHSLHPDGWPALPVFAGDLGPFPVDAAVGPAWVELAELVAGLAAAEVDVAAVELTTADLHQVGLRVVRAVSPQLTPIHGDHRWPFLGGTTPDVHRRYPGATSHGPFPSPHPHPLG